MMWNILVLAASFLVLIFLFWTEIKRPQKQRLIWRLLASFLAVASLVCVAIPPFYQGKRSFVSEREVLLLTEGFSADSLRSSPQETLVYTADEAIFKASKSPRIKFMADLGLWRKTLPQNASIYILGNGLAEAELQSLDTIPVRFNQPEPPAGIQKINWTHRLTAGENFRVQGNFFNPKKTDVKLVLKELNTQLDSEKTGTKRSMDFSFAAVPKQSGKAVFRLLALSGKDTLESEFLPVIIEPKKTLKVLLLSASPDFETRFLKNWLAENAYAVAARSTISKNKTTTDFGNMNKLPLEKITPNLLQNFDVLVCDASEFGSLSKAETAAILAQSSRQGLGLIFRADSANASFIRQNFATYPTNDPQKILNLKLNDESGLRLNIQADHPSFIKNQPNSQILVQDQLNRLLVSRKLFGAGKLLLSTLNNTFSWQLSGKNTAYAAYWSLLFDKAARRISQKQTVSTQIYADKNSMTTVRLETPVKTVQVKADGNDVAFNQNPAIPFMQEGVFWPKKSGWITVANGQNLPAELYIYDHSDWKPLKSAQKTINTSQYAAKSPANQQENNQLLKNEPVYLPKILFYLLFLASCTFLWFETKLL